MPSLSSIIDRDLWNLLSDPLFSHCTDLLGQDLSPDNPDPLYVTRKSAPVYGACQDWALGPGELTDAQLLTAKVTGALPDNPRLGEFLLHPEASKLGVAAVLFHQPQSVPAVDLRELDLFFVTVSKSLLHYQSGLPKLHGLFRGLVAGIAPDAVDVQVPAWFWEEAMVCAVLAEDAIFSELSSMPSADRVPSHWLRSDLPENLVSRVHALPRSQQASLLESFARSDISHWKLELLLTAAEAV